jgi:hypothetical protein
MFFRQFALTVIALATVGTLSVAQAGTTRDAAPAAQAVGVQLVPTGKGFAVPATAGQTFAAQLAGNGIDYHGGPVMKNGVNAYIIWYGDWAAQGGPNAKTIITDLFNNIGGTPYYNINTTYYEGKNKPKKQVKNKVTLAGQIDDVGKSLGSALTDANIRTLVNNALTSGRCQRHLLRADHQGRQRDFRLLHRVLRLAHPRHDVGHRHQVLLRR